MQLIIEGRLETFIPLQTFRSQHGLPEEFTLAYFEPKDWTGLGSIEQAGKALLEVKRRLVLATPGQLRPSDLGPAVDRLADQFQQELLAINSVVGLRQVEIEFAVAGFADVLQRVAFKLIQLGQIYCHVPEQMRREFDFLAVYQAWLDGSTRIATTTRSYTWGEHEYRVQVIYNAYGRVGLKVQVGQTTTYVADMGLACPAASYMLGLCGEVAQAMVEGLTS
jgi:hypothetical protein